MPSAKEQKRSEAEWIQDLNNCSDTADSIIAFMKLLVGTMEFYPTAINLSIERILKLELEFSEMKEIYSVLDPWFGNYGPSYDWGFFDKIEFPMDQWDAFITRWDELAKPLLESATDFDSALVIYKHGASHSQYLAELKMLEMASTPEHALAWLAQNQNGNIHRYSQRVEGKLLELATTDEVRREMLKQSAFSPTATFRLMEDLGKA